MPAFDLGQVICTAVRMTLIVRGCDQDRAEVTGSAELKVDLSGYANELAAIHTTLKRLNEAGEIRLIPKPSGRHAYLWQKPPRAMAIGPDVAQFIREMGAGPDQPGRSARPSRRRKK